MKSIRLHIRLMILLLGLVLIWNRYGNTLTVDELKIAQETSTQTGEHQLRSYLADLGVFLPVQQQECVTDGLFSLNVSPLWQLKIFGVTFAAPFHWMSTLQQLYILIRNCLVLPFEHFQIGYPFHCFW